MLQMVALRWRKVKRDESRPGEEGQPIIIFRERALEEFRINRPASRPEPLDEAGTGSDRTSSGDSSKIRRSVQGAGEKPSRLRRNSALPAHQLVDPLHGNSDMGSKSHLRDSKRFEKFLQKDFTRMKRKAVFGNHFLPLLISNLLKIPS